MHCFDCAQEGRDSAGVGVCTSCGLFICGDHARITGTEVQRTIGVLPRSSPLAARRLVCVPCRAAETAH
ncbi:hypothetical protein ADL00_00580 [Streptomyces sp. AS58]|uniref:DUF2180 family protein n=1 Tax=Streptomyces TaxID=1883 RepID=UPI0006ADF4C4|nr:DUF2180 family protein [Streptomyces sp. AS58]KOV74833.1 hypothetical protein ADL00_00580 [Streptomyces sp. AS58]